MPYKNITSISKDRADKIIEEREPQGLFITLSNSGYIAIDNNTGDAWTEEFNTLEEACKWLTDTEATNN